MHGSGLTVRSQLPDRVRVAQVGRRTRSMPQLDHVRPGLGRQGDVAPAWANPYEDGGTEVGHGEDAQVVMRSRRSSTAVAGHEASSVGRPCRHG